MSRRRRPGQERESSSVDSALGALGSEDLRELIREVLGELKEDVRGRVIDRLVERAARKGTGWEPEGPDEEAVDEVSSFLEAARRTHYADPGDVDDFLRRGADAFVKKDYRTARRIFHALIPPLDECEIDLGQHETVSEVLSVDTGQCAAQYVVSTYMTSDPGQRADAVRAAIRETGDLGLFWRPIEEMEAVAIEPLPELQAFLPEWRNLVEGSVSGAEHRGVWGFDEDRWLREVVQRLEGSDGIATLARSTRAGEDLEEWCRLLVESGAWTAALSAFEEAAEIVKGGAHWRGDFLDGAALAAQELGRRDLPSRLGRAWREAPSMLRLRRWLGAARSKAAVRKRAAEALEACPRRDHRQRAVLHLAVADFASAAKLLSSAPGLGWSRREHPGHLLFPIFAGLLGGGEPGELLSLLAPSVRGLDLDEMELMSADPDEPQLPAPEVADLLEAAGVRGPIRGASRPAMLAAMRKAAEKRIKGVTENQRRRQYGHAAHLVATCAALDPSPAGAQWLAGLRSRYLRYPALKRAFNEYLGGA